MATATAPPPAITIQRGGIYTLDQFEAGTGIGTCALRTARRKGLKVSYLAGRAYVRGDAFLDYVEKLDSEEDEEQAE